MNKLLYTVMIFLNVPAYDNSGPRHWHSWLENTYRGFKRVEQENWLKPERSQELANIWGSEITFVKDGGHLASADGFYEWPDVVATLEELAGNKLQLL